MIAGVVIDNWKLSIFRKHLDAASYQYTEHPGLTHNTMILKVTCDSAHKLQPVVQAANNECRTARDGAGNT